MNGRITFSRVLFRCLLPVILTGCVAHTQEISTPEPTLHPPKTLKLPTPSPDTHETTFEVTFDANHNCTVSGPSEVETGDYLLMLDNLSELKVDLAATHLIDGHDFQDLLEYQSEPGEPFVKVYWMSQPNYFTKDHKVWNYSLDEAGEHAILILQHVFEGAWICDSFQVTE